MAVEDAKTAAFIQHAGYGDAIKLQQMLDMRRLWSGDVNAATLGNDAWVVDENAIANIRKGDLLSTNAFHHEGLHFIQDNMSTAQLEEMKLAIETELISSNDPKLLKLAVLAQDIFERRYGGKFEKGSLKGYRDEAGLLIADIDPASTSAEGLLRESNIIKITPEMREKVLKEGISTFSAGGSIGNFPSRLAKI